MTEESITKEATVKYENEWDKTGPEHYGGCLILIPVLLLLLLAFLLSGEFPSASKYLEVGAFALFILCVFYWKNYVGPPKCPRCKLNFDYYHPRAVRYCVNCGLPKYYGSSKYFDRWGSKDGNEMLFKISRGEL